MTGRKVQNFKAKTVSESEGQTLGKDLLSVFGRKLNSPTVGHTAGR